MSCSSQVLLVQKNSHLKKKKKLLNPVEYLISHFPKDLCCHRMKNGGHLLSRSDVQIFGITAGSALQRMAGRGKVEGN